MTNETEVNIYSSWELFQEAVIFFNSSVFFNLDLEFKSRVQETVEGSAKPPRPPCAELNARYDWVIGKLVFSCSGHGHCD